MIKLTSPRVPSCRVSQHLPQFNWKDSYWQCLITIQWTQSRYEGSLTVSTERNQKLRELWWCDGGTVRLGEFMYQIMESPAITQMTLDGREMWLIVLLGCSPVHYVSLNRTPRDQSVSGELENFNLQLRSGRASHPRPTTTLSNCLKVLTYEIIFDYFRSDTPTGPSFTILINNTNLEWRRSLERYCR